MALACSGHIYIDRLMQSILRKAATLLLVRDSRREPQGLEVLMVRRSPHASFGPGAMVFPGGVLEQEDLDSQMAAASSPFTPAMAIATMPDAESPQEALGFYITAIREAFEEIALLLAKTPNGDWWQPPAKPQLLSLREDINNGENNFAQWLLREELTLAVDALVYFAYWITPEGSPLRFATRFFMASYEADHLILPDQQEIVGHAWFTPKEALQGHEKGTIRLMDPTAKTLQWLIKFSSAAAAMQAYKGKTVNPILPKVLSKKIGGREVLFPWDHGYDDH